ncbi:MAG: hypothetical protein Q8R16_01370 [bacterium]|nr:hypothetical protein [bacterium]
MSAPSHRFRSPPRSWSQRTPAKKRAWSRLVLLTLILGGLCALLWGWRIQAVTVEGSTVIPNAAVRDAILAELQGNWIGIVPRSSMLLARTRRLERVLQERFAFGSASARRTWSGELIVQVTEQPIAGVVEFADGGRMLVSVAGIILGPAPESLNEAANLIRWQSLSGTMRTGESFLSAPRTALLRAIWAELDQTAGGTLRPQRIAQRAGSANEFDIHTTRGVVVSVSTDEQARDQLTKLRAVLSDAQNATQINTLRSIDLRYGDRVYIQ